MNLPILIYNSSNIEEFSLFWKGLYDYKHEELYKRNIGKSKFLKDDLKDLFIWKNGGNLSALKQKSFEKIADKLDVINNLKSNFSFDFFKSEFELKSAVIWKIYLLHIICPDKYPIFDQHVCRSHYFITQNIKKEIPSNNRLKEEIYFDEYINFFNKLAEERMSRKELDEALSAKMASKKIASLRSQ